MKMDLRGEPDFSLNFLLKQPLQKRRPTAPFWYKTDFLQTDIFLMDKIKPYFFFEYPVSLVQFCGLLNSVISLPQVLCSPKYYSNPF